MSGLAYQPAASRISLQTAREIESSLSFMAFLLRLKGIIPPSLQRPLRDRAWRTLRTLGLRGLIDGSLYAAREYHREWRLDAALKCLETRLGKRPQDAAARLMKARVLMDMGLLTQAVEETRLVLKNDPLNLEAISLLSSMGDHVPFDVRVAHDALQAGARSPRTYISALRYLNAAGLLTEALSLSEKALQADAALTAPVMFERAVALEGLHRFEEAIDAANAIALTPNAMDLIARCHLELGRPDSAARTLGHDPNSRGQSLEYDKTLLPVLYALGDLRGAHLSYRRRPSSRLIARTFHMPSPDRIDVLSGRYRTLDAFLFSETGPGDEIRFSSFYGELSRYFKSVTITCDPRLTQLFERSFPTIRFIPVTRYRNEFRTEKLADREKLPDRTFWNFANDASIAIARQCGFVCSTLDLLADLRQKPHQFRDSPSRLRANVGACDGARDALRIGLSWRSLLVSPSRNTHYLDVSDLAPLANLSHCEFWNLQAGVTEDELGWLKGNLPNFRAFDDLDIKDDFDGLASAIAGLDLVISPPTNIIELAGMLGIPTWLLSTSRTTAWRRMPDGSDIWYPSGRIEMAEPPWDRPKLMQKVVQSLSRQMPTL